MEDLPRPEGQGTSRLEAGRRPAGAVRAVSSRAVAEFARSLEATLRAAGGAGRRRRGAGGARARARVRSAWWCSLRSSPRRAAKLGAGTVRIVAAVGLPFGAEGARPSRATGAQAVADGADVLDVVASLPLLANGDFPGARDELASAVAGAAAAAPEGRQIAVRAVIETCYCSPLPGGWPLGWRRPPAATAWSAPPGSAPRERRPRRSRRSSASCRRERS